MWYLPSSTTIADMNQFLSIFRGTYLASSRHVPLSQLGGAALQIHDTNHPFSCTCEVPDPRSRQIVSSVDVYGKHQVLHRDPCPT